MLVSKKVIDKMEERGFEMVEGAAVLNDSVVVELRHPYRSTKVLTLKTPEAVAVFNQECGSDSWAVFRPLIK